MTTTVTTKMKMKTQTETETESETKTMSEKWERKRQSLAMQTTLLVIPWVGDCIQDTHFSLVNHPVRDIVMRKLRRQYKSVFCSQVALHYALPRSLSCSSDLDLHCQSNYYLCKRVKCSEMQYNEGAQQNFDCRPNHNDDQIFACKTKCIWMSFLSWDDLFSLAIFSFSSRYVFVCRDTYLHLSSLTLLLSVIVVSWPHTNTLTLTWRRHDSRDVGSC